MRTFVFVAGFALASGQAHGQSLTGNDLHTACSSNNNELIAYCMGAVIGFVEGTRYGLAYPMMLEGEKDADEINQVSSTVLNICAPEDVSNGQLRDIVANYLRDTPEKRHFSARLLVHLALTKAFPCKL